jgi:poly-gamma-glutamate capsule biosynthesis protein CapA/YwtB (metallophosphatase superfamily)
MVFILIIVTAILLILYVFSPYKRPFPTESDYTYHKTPWWQLYYSSKYVNPVRNPQRGSGLKELFAKDMSPGPDAGFSSQKTITIKAVGDLLCREDFAGEGSASLWDDIGEYVFSGDLRIANLEFAINENWIIRKLLRYSIPPAEAEPLLGDRRYGKFNLLSVGNNHINDSLSAGIISTCDYLDSIGIIHSGANRTAEEQDQFPIIECNGFKIAFLSYTFSTNAIPLEKGFSFGANLVRFNALDDKDYEPSLILRHIAIAKERGADFIIACNHWGVEFEYYPPKRIVKRAHELLDAGIDLIIGHHPHTLNPVERYVTKDQREAFVFYSLGNLTSWGLKFPMQKASAVAEINLTAGYLPDGKKAVRIGEVKLMPVIHLMHKQSRSVKHRIVPVLKTARDIRSGKKLPFLNPENKWLVLTADREFNRHFLQNGIKYL